MNSDNGFFAGLFDFSFTQFVTLRVISILYILAIALTGLIAVIAIIAGFSNGVGSGILSLLIAPVAWLIYVLIIRMGLETLIVAFRIESHAHKIAENTTRDSQI